MNRRRVLTHAVSWAGVIVSSGWSSALRAAEEAKTQRIEKALEARVQIDFLDVTLKKAAEFISALHDIEIEIDLESLKRIGVNEKSKVSYLATNIRLKEAVKEMFLLVHDDLTYEIKDGKLRFVAKEK